VNAIVSLPKTVANQPSDVRSQFLPKFICLLTLAALLGLPACTTPPKTSGPESPRSQTVEHFKSVQILSTDYLLILPADYDAGSGKRWPLILFLHGAGERGTNVWLVAKRGLPKVAPQDKNFPFIVVSPQCPPGEVWSDDVLLALLDDVEKRYAVDFHRVYLTGLSMGGYGTWNLALGHPGRFAAVAPVCGGGETLHINLARHYEAVKLSQIKTLGVWAFHGAKDPIVSPDDSKRMVDELKNLGCQDVKLTIYPEAKHDCWTKVYADPELYRWFLQHSR